MKYFLALCCFALFSVSVAQNKFPKDIYQFIEKPIHI